MYKNFVLEIQANYQSMTYENKLTFVCNRIYKEDNWNAYNKGMLVRLKEYKEMYYTKPVKEKKTRQS